MWTVWGGSDPGPAWPRPIDLATSVRRLKTGYYMEYPTDQVIQIANRPICPASKLMPVGACNEFQSWGWRVCI